jgi:hypothetical protein
LCKNILFSLQENQAFTCVKIFAVRFLSGKQQRASLLCVLYRAHGKGKTHGKKIICRAFLLGSTANPRVCRGFFIAHGKPAVRFITAHAKQFFPERESPLDTEGEPLAPRGGQFFSLCRASSKKRTAKRCLGRAFLFWCTTKYFPQFMSPMSQIQLLIKKFFST